MSNDSGASLSATLDPADPASAAFRETVNAAINDFLATQVPVLESIGPELRPLQETAAALLSGGKRLRPAFCVWGQVAAAGLPDTAEADQLAPLFAAAASLDLLHVSALVHDDVMDGSDLRRGQPAAHRQFEALHASSDWLGESTTFGRAGAILLGDLLVMWSVQMLHQSSLDPLALARALPLLEAMRTEVTCGQFLDVVAQSHDPSRHGLDRALDEANRVVEYKSARYTVQRPCQFGAALGGGDDPLQQVLGDYGSPLGRAFQFRDDLLGVFGDSSVTGKPAGDDLREGKRTLLIAHTYAQTSDAGRQALDTSFGDPTLEGTALERLLDVITESGAKDAVESMIDKFHHQAVTTLDGADMYDDGRTGLVALAEAAVRRTF